MPDYLGDLIATGVSVQHKFMTVNASGAPTTLGDSPSLILYVNASVSGVASGLSGTFDFDGRTGLNHVRLLVTTSVTGIAAGNEYQIVVATGSVSGVSLNGYPVCAFSLQNRVSNANVTSSTMNIGAIVTAFNTIAPASVTAISTNVGAIVTAFNTIAPANVTAISTIAPARVTAQGIDIGAIVTSISTIAPARVTAQGIDIGAIVTAVNTIVPARVTAQGIDVGAIVTAFNTIANANVTSISTNVGAIVTAINTIANANVTAITTNVGAIVTAVNTIVPANVTALASGVITWPAFDSSTLVNGRLDTNVGTMASVTVIGSGSAASLWRGA